MPWNAASYANQFPLAPLGGLFVCTIGLFIMLGAPLPRARMTLSYVGLGAATIALVLGGRLSAGLPRPSGAQVAALVVAIVVEIIAFVVLMPRVRPRGERAVVVVTLAIVGAHFIIMIAAFGPLIGALAALCVVNAAAAWRQPRYTTSAAWLMDGALKLLCGALLLWTSPLFLS